MLIISIYHTEYYTVPYTTHTQYTLYFCNWFLTQKFLFDTFFHITCVLSMTLKRILCVLFGFKSGLFYICVYSINIYAMHIIINSHVRICAAPISEKFNTNTPIKDAKKINFHSHFIFHSSFISNWWFSQSARQEENYKLAAAQPANEYICSTIVLSVWCINNVMCACNCKGCCFAMWYWTEDWIVYIVSDSYLFLVIEIRSNTTYYQQHLQHTQQIFWG